MHVIYILFVLVAKRYETFVCKVIKSHLPKFVLNRLRVCRMVFKDDINIDQITTIKILKQRKKRKDVQ